MKHTCRLLVPFFTSQNARTFAPDYLSRKNSSGPIRHVGKKDSKANLTLSQLWFVPRNKETEIFLYVTMIVIDSGGNLKEHIGLKHMGISSKDWRNPEFKAVRDSASSHQAWEFVPAAGDPFRYNRQT